jgi:hypothetical protein
MKTIYSPYGVTNFVLLSGCVVDFGDIHLSGKYGVHEWFGR